MTGTPVGGLLDAEGYRRFLADTHPALQIDDARLGGVPSFIAPLDIREPLAPGLARRGLCAASGFIPELVTPPALFIGTPFERYDQTHLLEGLPSVFELSERAARVARARGLDVVVLTNVQAQAVVQQDWEACGWVTFPSFPDTVVDLAAGSFDAHLQSLPPGDRSGIRRNIKRFNRAGHRVERLRDASVEGPSLYRCYRPFYEGAAVRWQPHTLAYFRGLTALGDDVRLTVARSQNDTLLGFVVAFEDPDGVQAGRIGVHPDYHRRDAIYFRLLYQVLDDALEQRGGRTDILSMEPTGYRMKRHLGARKVPLINLILGVSDHWWLLLRSFAGLGRRMLQHLEDRKALERWY